MEWDGESQSAYFFMLHIILRTVMPKLCSSELGIDTYENKTLLLPPRSGHHKLFCSPAQGSLVRTKAPHAAVQ
jgi:hypothetical protein